MTTELLEIMQKDIKRCEDAQSSNEGTRRLYQALIAKYNGIFEGFEKGHTNLWKRQLLEVESLTIDQS